jgi:ammonia channel protein AmtB
MILSSGLVFMMIPAIALFYSGAADRFSTFTLLRLPILTAAVLGVQVRGGGFLRQCFLEYF